MSVEDERWRVEELLHQEAVRLTEVEEELKAVRGLLVRMEVLLEAIGRAMGIAVHG